jgi:hypothetical protein
MRLGKEYKINICITWNHVYSPNDGSPNDGSPK